MNRLKSLAEIFLIAPPLHTRLIGTLPPIPDCARLCPVRLRLIQLHPQLIDLALQVLHVLALCLVIGFEFAYLPVQGKAVRVYILTVDLPSLGLEAGVLFTYSSLPPPIPLPQHLAPSRLLIEVVPELPDGCLFAVSFLAQGI